MALKIKIPGGSGGMPPDASFPVPTRSLGQMRKLLRGPGQATYDFDGVRPGLLVVKKGWPAGQTLPSLASLLFAHAIKHMLCFGTSFLCAEKGGKDAGSFAGFLPMKTGNSLTTRSHYIQEGAAAPGLGVAVFFQPRAQPVPGGPRPPPCIALVQESTSPPVFLKRKPADHRGA